MMMADQNPEKDSFFKEIDEELRQESYAKLWKKYGAIEAVGYQLFGSVYGHFSMVGNIENMENYGKHNDAFVADPECQKA